MATQTLEFKHAKSYVSHGGKAAFSFMDILDIIKKLIGGCTTNAAAQRWSRRNEAATKDALTEDIKAKKLFSSAKDRQAAVNATYETFVKATRAELRQMDMDD